MSNTDVKVSVKTGVEGQKDITELQKEIVKLGSGSKETDKQVEDLASTMSDLVVATQLRDKLAENNTEFDKTTDAVNSAQEALARSREEFLLLSENADPKQLKEMNKAISDQEKELKKLERAQESARKKYDHANTAIDKSSESIKKLVRDNIHYADSTLQASKAQEALIEELRKTKDVAEAYNNLGVEDHRKKIEELKNDYKLLKESGKLSSDELKDAHRKLTDEVEKHQKALRGTEQLYKNFKKWSLRLAPVAVALAAVTKSAVDYETAMVGLRKVANGTAEDLNQLEKDVLKLSRTIPMSAVEIAKMAEAGARAGKSVNELTGFVELSAKAAGAFNITAEEAGQAIATLGSVFGGTAEETEKLMEAINMFDDSVNATAPNITEVINKVGSIGQMAGYSGQQLSAMAASLLETGNKASVASTALKNTLNALSNIKNGTTDAKDSLEKLGFSAEEFAQLMRDDAEGAVIQFLRRLRELDSQTQIDIASKMFGSAAQAQVMQMALNVDSLADKFKKVGDYTSYAGKMSAQFDLANQSTESQLQIVKNQLNEISIVLGTQLLPVIKDILGELSEAIGIIQYLSKETSKLSESFNGLDKSMGLAEGTVSRFIKKLPLLGDSLSGVKNKLGDMYGALKAMAALSRAEEEEARFKKIYLEKEIELLDDGTVAIKKQIQAIEGQAEAKLKVAEAFADFEEKQKSSTLAMQEHNDEINLLKESLNKLGIDYDLVATGISSANRELIEGLRDVGNSSAATSKIISQSFGVVLNEIKTPEEFTLLVNTFNTFAEQSKYAGSELTIFQDKLNQLTESVRLGIITDAEFSAKKAELVKIIGDQAAGFSTVNAEISKQIGLITEQIAQEKKLTDSLINKLEAEKKLAEVQGNRAYAQELQLQIDRARIDSMNKEARLIKEIVAEYKKELAVLLQRQKAGEKLTEEEEKRIKLLQNEIAVRENEIEATKAAALAKEQDAASADKNSNSLKKLTSSIQDVADANKQLGETLGETNKALENLTRERKLVSIHMLDGLADQAMMSKEAIEALQAAMDKMNRTRMDGEVNGLQASIANQINSFQDLEEKIGKVENANMSQLKAWERMIKGMTYVDKEHTERVLENIKAMQKALEASYEQIDNRNDELKASLNAMRHQNDEMTRQASQRKELAAIEKEINNAELNGEKEKVKKLEEQLKLTKQLHTMQNLDVKKQKMEQERKERIEIASKSEVKIELEGKNIGELDLNNASDRKRLGEIVVQEILRKRAVSTAYHARRNR